MKDSATTRKTSSSELIDEWELLRTEARTKADKNKRRTRLQSRAILVCSALIPTSIVASTHWNDFVLSRLLPSALAAAVAVLTGWLQSERPKERWLVFRRWQRTLESERFRYDQSLEPYSRDSAANHTAFAEYLARARTTMHDDWNSVLAQSDYPKQAIPEK